MNKLNSIIQCAANKKILLMLSGGKDSITSLILLKEANLDVTAIHFFHRWSPNSCREEATKFCQQYQVPLIIRDFTKEFLCGVSGYLNGRPCLLCKKEMYKIVLDVIAQGQFDFLAIGDNKNDRTSIARMNAYISNSNRSETLECNSYFGSEMGIVLPPGVRVLRPLISAGSDEIESYLRQRNITIRRLNSTGDKYFEYHREGCFAQFIEAGYPVSEELLFKSKIYNECITEFARKENILASIHLPSTFIVTIPQGFESSAAEYLRAHGLPVDDTANFSWDNSNRTIYSTIRHSIFKDVHPKEYYVSIFKRFSERLELPLSNFTYDFNDGRVLITANSDVHRISFLWTQDNECLDIIVGLKQSRYFDFVQKVFESVVIELFKTRNYSFFIK